LVFAFFLFNPAPMLFNRVHEAKVLASPRAAEYQGLQQEFDATFAARKRAAESLAAAEHGGSPGGERVAAREAFIAVDRDLASVRSRATALVKDVAKDSRYSDVNYVFPTFILTYMPVGLVGLMIAAILSAAMSASSGEMNALATATVMDFYRRHVNPTAPDSTYVLVSKIATAFWGLFACGVAVFATNLGSLIEVVNAFGSYFYGSVLGVFILALGFKRANGHGAFIGLIAGLIVVFSVAYHPATQSISYLWYNVIGAVVVTAVGLVVSMAMPGTPVAVTVDRTRR
ncbi:MAG: sodium:solute symporter, partial [Acidobacteriota bacterium]